MPISSFSASQSVLTLLEAMAGDGGRSALITRLIVDEAKRRNFDVSEVQTKPTPPCTLAFARGESVIWTFTTTKQGQRRSYPATVLSVGPKLVTILAITNDGPTRRSVPAKALTHMPKS